MQPEPCNNLDDWLADLDAKQGEPAVNSTHCETLPGPVAQAANIDEEIQKAAQRTVLAGIQCGLAFLESNDPKDPKEVKDATAPAIRVMELAQRERLATRDSKLDAVPVHIVFHRGGATINTGAGKPKAEVADTAIDVPADEAKEIRPAAGKRLDFSHLKPLPISMEGDTDA